MSTVKPEGRYANIVGCWCAWAECGQTGEEIACRLAEVPEPMREEVRKHCRTVYILQAKKRQAPDPPPWRRCCATCERLNDAGTCEAFDEVPPMDFIEQENDCDEYTEVVPF